MSLIDPKFLYQKYIVEELSLNQISEIVKEPYLKVRQFLLKNNIKIRSKSEGSRIRRRKNNNDYFIFNRELSI